MKVKRVWPLVGLVLFLTGGALLWANYERMPWVGTHFSLTESEGASRWEVDLKVQQGRGLGGAKAGLADVPEPSRQASLVALLLQQGRRSGLEWLQELRIESISSVQFSWEQKNKDILNSRWEARVGGSGGVQGLEIKPPGRSIWLRQDLITPWLLTLWPNFPQRGLDPGQSWSSRVPFTVVADELDRPFQAHWNCTWTYRGSSPEAATPLAMIDVQAQADSSEQPVEGMLRAEVAYALEAHQVYGARGAYSLKLAARTQATEASTVTLLDGVTGQFQIVRKIPARDGAIASPTP